ncbi:hypothetical protein ACWGB8_19110 [Kitasatospora sp. NPDC054939]
MPATRLRGGRIGGLDGLRGSFHFDHLLTDDIAGQVYGVCAAGDPPLVVLDDDPTGRAALLGRMRAYRKLLASSGA